MPKPAEPTLVAQCADGGVVRLPNAAKLTPIVRNAASWVSFLKMLAGGPPAAMVVQDRHGTPVDRMTVIDRHRADRDAFT